MKLEPFMQFHATELKRCLLLGLFLVGMTAPRLWAQAADSPIVFQGPSAITTTLVDCPTAGQQSGSRSDNDQWLKIEWRYQVTPKGPSPYVDTVEFRVWAEGRDLYAPEATSAEGIPVILTGTVTYINLTQNHEAYGVVYIHPSTMARYSSKSGASDFSSKFNVHVEAYVGGAKMDLFDKDKPQDPTWYQQGKAIPGLLLRQDQCAFMLSDPMRYPQIKPQPGSQQ